MRSTPRATRTPAEWVTLAISVVVVGSLLVIALVEQSRLEDEAPASLTISFDTGASWPVGDDYYVPFTVTNRGSKAISSADLIIEVYDGESLVESSKITVEFLPLQGRQDGIYITAHDPSRHEYRGSLESAQFP